MLNTQDQNILLGLCYLGFEAAPGSFYFGEFERFAEQGNGLLTVADFFTNEPAFRAPDIYPDSLSPNAFTAKVVGLLGLEGNQLAESYLRTEDSNGTPRGRILLEASRFILTTNDPAFAQARQLLENVVNVSRYYSIERSIDSRSLSTLQDALSGVTLDPLTVELAKDRIDEQNVTGNVLALTTGEDTVGPTSTTLQSTAQGDLIDGSVPGTLNTADVIDGGAGVDILKAAAFERDGNNTVLINPSLDNVEIIRFDVIATTAGALTANNVTLDLSDSRGETEVEMSIDNGTHGELRGLELNDKLTLSGGGSRFDTQISLDFLGDLSGDRDTLRADLGLSSALTVESINVLNVEVAQFNVLRDVAIANFNNSASFAGNASNDLRELLFSGNGNVTLGRASSAEKLSFAGLGVVNTASVDASELSGNLTIFLASQVGRFAATGGSGTLTVENRLPDSATAPVDNSALNLTAGTGALSAVVGASEFIEINGSAQADFVDATTFVGGDPATTPTAAPTAAPSPLDALGGLLAGDLLGGLGGLLAPAPAPTSAPTAPEVPSNGIIVLGDGNDTVKLRGGTLNVDMGAGDDIIEIQNVIGPAPGPDGVLGTEDDPFVNLSNITAADQIVGGAGRDTLVTDANEFSRLVSDDGTAERVQGVEVLRATSEGDIFLDASGVPRDIRDFEFENPSAVVAFNLANTDRIRYEGATIGTFVTSGSGGGLVSQGSLFAASTTSNSVLNLSLVGATLVPEDVTQDIDGTQGVRTVGPAAGEPALAANSNLLTFANFEEIVLTSVDGNVDGDADTRPLHVLNDLRIVSNVNVTSTLNLTGRGDFEIRFENRNNADQGRTDLDASALGGVVTADLRGLGGRGDGVYLGSEGDDEFIIDITAAGSYDGGVGTDQLSVVLLEGQTLNLVDSQITNFERIVLRTFDSADPAAQARLDLSSQAGESFVVTVDPDFALGAVRVDLADGADVITLGAGGGRIGGGGGNDILNGSAGGAFEVMVGGDGADTINITSDASGVDVVAGLAGNDTINIGVDPNNALDEVHFRSVDGTDIVNGLDVGTSATAEDLIMFLDGMGTGAVNFAKDDTDSTALGTAFVEADRGVSFSELMAFTNLTGTGATLSNQVVLIKAQNGAGLINGVAETGLLNAYLVVDNGNNVEVYFDADWGDGAARTQVANLVGVDINNLGINDFGVYAA